MSFAINKNFSRDDSQINKNPEQNRTIHSASSIPFERRVISNILQRMPIIIKTLANLCQLLDNHSLTQLDQIQQGTIACILWNEDQSHPIAIDQNNYLTAFRQSIRESIHEFLELTQQILIIHDKNDEINFMIQKSMKYLFTLNEYRTKRQLAYNYFSHNDTLADAMLILTNLDKQQFHQLRLIALHLRQFFLKLIVLITPKFSILE